MLRPNLAAMAVQLPEIPAVRLPDIPQAEIPPMPDFSAAMAKAMAPFLMTLPEGVAEAMRALHCRPVPRMRIQ